MNPEDRAVEEIRALLGTAPEVPVPRGVDERVRTGARRWARQRAGVGAIRISWPDRVAFGLIGLELLALLWVAGPRLEVDQLLRGVLLGLAGLNAAALLASPAILLIFRRREQILP